MAIDEEKLRSMSVQDRHQVWVNAKKKDSDEARLLVEKIEQLGLPYSDDKNLRHSDPIFLTMVEIIFSDKAKAAAIEATEIGMPALAGIDPFLLERLGVDYGAHNEATVNAGAIVASMMATLGYKKSGKKGKLPATCIAKTAEIYVSRK